MAGYYDPRSKRLRMVTGAANGMREVTLAHGLTRCLAHGTTRASSWRWRESG